MRAARAGLALLTALSCACVTYERGRLSAVSTAKPPLDLVVVAESVEGRACGQVFRTPVALAIDDALGKVHDANALIDMEYRFERLCLVVRGTAVRVR